MSDYVSRVSADLQQRYAGQPEYLQAVLTWLEMIAPALEDNPIYERVDLLTRMVEPDRMLTFTVPWMDDQGMAHTNHGYRVQFNSAIGPYKGGLRFHPSVNPSIVKFLGFEQTYKNALTGLPIGGAAGGADFDPRGKSSREIMRFCQSFMTALYRLIGADTDIPAGDIGVGSREIGYLYGQYKRLTGKAESSALTGKGLTYGGSVIRQEAAGFGTVYFLARMLEHQGETLEGKRLAVSGFGNMSWGVCRKSAELGGKVVTLSGPDGYVYDPDGVCTQEKFDFMLSMRAGGADKVEPYADHFGVEFFPGKRDVYKRQVLDHLQGGNHHAAGSGGLGACGEDLGTQPQEAQGLGGGGHIGRLHIVADVVGHNHHGILHVQLILGGAGDHDVHRHFPGPFAGEELHAEVVGVRLHLCLLYTSRCV